MTMKKDFQFAFVKTQHLIVLYVGLMTVFLIYFWEIMRFSPFCVDRRMKVEIQKGL